MPISFEMLTANMLADVLEMLNLTWPIWVMSFGFWMFIRWARPGRYL